MLLSSSRRRNAVYPEKLVRFDGDTYLRRSDGFDGVGINSDAGFVAARINLHGTSLTEMTIFELGEASSSPVLRFARAANNSLIVSGADSLGNTQFTASSSTSYDGTGGYLNILVSWNLATNSRQFYVDDADDLTSGHDTGTNDLVWDTGKSTIGAAHDNSDKGDFEVSLLMASNEEVDFSVEANRRKFFDAGGNLVDVGSDGSTPTGTQPLFFMGGAMTANYNGATIRQGWNQGQQLGSGGEFGKLAGIVGDITEDEYLPRLVTWDFDHESAVWDTDVTAASASAMGSAIGTALSSGSGYHRIKTTFTSSGSYVYYNGSPPSVYGLFILIVADTSTKWTGELRLNGAVNCKFVDHLFEVDGNSAQCVDLLRSSAKIAFEQCRFGHHWKNTTNASNFPIGVGGSMEDNEVSIQNCEFRRVFAVVDPTKGYKLNWADNFVTDVVDDVLYRSIRNGGDKYSYVYGNRNVIFDMLDDVAYSGNHPDIHQTGNSSDTSGDVYETHVIRSIAAGDTSNQYPCSGEYLSLDGGGATKSKARFKDTIVLPTALNGIAPSDKNFNISACMIAKPPLGERVPTTGTGWPTTYAGSKLRTLASLDTGDTPVIDNVLYAEFDDNAVWGVTPTNAIVADPADTLGGADAYDTRFPNMTGLTYDTDQVVIPAYTGLRTKQAYRKFIAAQYEPYDGSSTGWDVLGMSDPSTWHGDYLTPDILNTVSANGTGSSITLSSFTPEAGANKVLCVAIETEDTVTTVPTVDTVAFGATSLVKRHDLARSGNSRSTFWTVDIGSSVTAGDIVITLSGAPNQGSVVAAFVIENVKQQAPTQLDTATVITFPNTQSEAPTAAGILVGVWGNGESTDFTAGVDNTLIMSVKDATASCAVGITARVESTGGSYEQNADATSETIAAYGGYLFEAI